MKTLTKHFSFFIRSMGVLSLALMLWGSSTALAAPAGSDVSVRITADRSQVKVGQNITYTVRMTNRGPDDAYFVDTFFVIPAQLTLVEMTCDQGISPDTPACEYSSLKAGETVVSTLVATPNTAGRLFNRGVRVTARALFESTDAVDPNMHNNAVSISTLIIAKPAHH